VLAVLDLSTATPNASGYYTLKIVGGLPVGTNTGLKVSYSGDLLYSAYAASLGSIKVA
jgi:hypothetical protein